ncbi:MAG: hypothetical protein PGN09_01275 [Sphingomonas fennica]
MGQHIFIQSEQVMGEIRERLERLRLPADAIATVMAIVDSRGHPPAAPAPPALTHAEIARSFYKSSLKRTIYLGEKLGADMAWNMLLDLFAASEEGRSVCVSSLCIASGGPPTTALRHLHKMHDMALVRRAADQRDGRRIWVETTEETQAMMRRLIEEFCVPPPAKA